MKLDNFVSFGRPQSGAVIIQFMTELAARTAIPKPSRKQSNALKSSTKIACHNAHILKIYNRQ